jgi:hypothetical protein
MTTSTIASITKDQIVSVYSGRAGKCCCGCSGKYWYSSRHSQTAATRNTPVSDRQVARVLGIIQRHASDAHLLRNCVSLQIGNRLYNAYFR